MAIDRLKWVFLRRLIAIRTTPGLIAGWNTYVSADTRLDPHVYLRRRAELFNCHIGRFSRVGGTIINTDVGAFSSIADEVLIGGGGRHPLDQVSTSSRIYYPDLGIKPPPSDAPNRKFTDRVRRVKIGNDVWIGTRAMVLEGVTIGDGAVVGAMALVNKDVPPYAIVGGVPAKVLKYRHEPELRSALQQSKWWEWPRERLERIHRDFDENCPMTNERFRELAAE